MCPNWAKQTKESQKPCQEYTQQYIAIQIFNKLQLHFSFLEKSSKERGFLYLSNASFTSICALVKAALMCFTSTRVKARVPPSPGSCKVLSHSHVNTTLLQCRVMQHSAAQISVVQHSRALYLDAKYPPVSSGMMTTIRPHSSPQYAIKQNKVADIF